MLTKKQPTMLQFIAHVFVMLFVITGFWTLLLNYAGVFYSSHMSNLGLAFICTLFGVSITTSIYINNRCNIEGDLYQVYLLKFKKLARNKFESFTKNHPGVIKNLLLFVLLSSLVGIMFIFDYVGRTAGVEAVPIFFLGIAFLIWLSNLFEKITIDSEINKNSQ